MVVIPTKVELLLYITSLTRFSGPRRYEYHGNGLADGWHCVKGGREESSLLVDLRNELLQVTGVDIANL